MDRTDLLLEKLQDIEQLIRAQNLNLKEMLNFNEACRFLDLSASYLYKLTSRGDIPHYKPEGKKIYFHRKELIAWMKRNRISSNNELINIAINKVLR